MCRGLSCEDRKYKNSEQSDGSVQNREVHEMLSFEEYMRRFPQISRKRAEQLMEGECFFIEEADGDYALMPGRSTDLFEWVSLKPLKCDCSVFRAKKACSHTAAVVGIIEKNGGKIRYTDMFAVAEKELAYFKSRDTMYQYVLENFIRRMKYFSRWFSTKEKTSFLYQLALYVQTPGSHLTNKNFLECYRGITAYDYRDRDAIIKMLSDHWEECPDAVILVLSEERYAFSDKAAETILKSVSESNELTKRYIPILAAKFQEYFPREQLITYYDNVKLDFNTVFGMRAFLKRLVEEEPPLYDKFLELCNRVPNVTDLWIPDTAVIKKLLEAGYGDRLGRFLDYLIYRMRIEDYYFIIQYVPHDQFLKAWKKGGKRSSLSEEDEIEIDIREDPETDVDDLYLENLSPGLLEVILEYRPEYRKEINIAVRKKYRAAVKARIPAKINACLKLLAMGEDTIATKYASELGPEWLGGENLVYTAFVGAQLNTLEKLAPGLRKMEVDNAAGQNR